MSLQGPLIVVAEQPAAELVEALSAAGAFPIVETTWAGAPAAFLVAAAIALVSAILLRAWAWPRVSASV